MQCTMVTVVDNTVLYIGKLRRYSILKTSHHKRKKIVNIEVMDVN